MPSSLDALLAFLLAGLLAWLLVPLSDRLARRIGAIDAPNERSLHEAPTPSLGGLAILAGVVVAALIFLIWRSRIWALSFLIGQWAHALTDALDTLGAMLLFPFTTDLFSLGAWAYAGQTGRYVDAGAYFSGLGFVWDGFWLAWAVLSWRVLTRAYFRETIMVADPFWRRAAEYLPETALVAIYRISFFYGTCRWIAWLIWAHVVRSFAFDFSWGGPKWVDAVQSNEVNASGCSCPSCCSASPKLALSLAVAAAGRISARRARGGAASTSRSPRDGPNAR